MEAIGLRWGSQSRHDSSSKSKSKPQSSLGTTQAWFPTGKPICERGPHVPPDACRLSEPGLSYIRHCHVDRFPVASSINYVSAYKAEMGSFYLLTFICGSRKGKHREKAT